MGNFAELSYSLNERPRDTPHHTHFLQHNTSVGAVLSSIDESATDQSIRDCFKLGKDSPDQNCPLLVHLNRSCNVLVVLSNRRRYASSPAIRTKTAFLLVKKGPKATSE